MSGGLEDMIGGLLGGGGSSSSGGLGGMLNSLLGSDGGSGGGAAQIAGIAAVLAPMAGKFLQGGGLDSLLGSFKEAGLEDKAATWVGTGENAELAPAEAASVMPNAVKELAAEAGISEAEAAAVLAKVVPGVVSEVTPNGTVPPQDELDAALAKLGNG